MVIPKIARDGEEKYLGDAMGKEGKRLATMIAKIEPNNQGIGACKNLKTTTPTSPIHKENNIGRRGLNHCIKCPSIRIK